MHKVFRNTLTSKIFPLPLKRKNLLKDHPKEHKIKIRSRQLTLPISPKAEETHFNILNDIYPCQEFLRKRFNIDKSHCVFCDSDIKTLELLFYLTVPMRGRGFNVQGSRG